MSNWRAEKSLTEYLKSYQIVAIAGSIPGRLTEFSAKKARNPGCIMTGAHADTSRAIELAKQYPGLVGMDLAKVVSPPEKIQSWTQQTLKWESPNHHPGNYHVVVYDYRGQVSNS